MTQFERDLMEHKPWSELTWKGKLSRTLAVDSICILAGIIIGGFLIICFSFPIIPLMLAVLVALVALGVALVKYWDE